MSNNTYDYPLVAEVDLADAQAVVTIPALTALYSSLKVLDASGIIGGTPAAVQISIGDGTTAALYGTIDIAAAQTIGEGAVITLNLTPAAYEINENSPTTMVFTNTVAPAAAIAGLKVFVGYY